MYSEILSETKKDVTYEDLKKAYGECGQMKKLLMNRLDEVKRQVKTARTNRFNDMMSQKDADVMTMLPIDADLRKLMDEESDLSFKISHLESEMDRLLKTAIKNRLDHGHRRKEEIPGEIKAIEAKYEPWIKEFITLVAKASAIWSKFKLISEKFKIEDKKYHKEGLDNL